MTPPALRAVLLVLCLFPFAAATGPTGPSPEAPREHLVTFAHAADASLPARHGLRVLEVHPLAGTMLVEGPPAAAAALAREPQVLSVEPNGRVRAASAGTAGAGWNGAGWNGAGWNGAGWNGAGWNGAGWNGAGWNSDEWDGPVPPWGLAAVRAPEAWVRGVPEARRLVCIVDSGMDGEHPALVARLGAERRGIDLTGGNAPFTDAHGHGTHMAGIVAAAPHETGIRGVGASTLAVAKALGPDGTGATSAVIAGIDWCVAQGANVVLLALSEDDPTKALRRSVQRALASGVILVAAAGNDGPCARCVTAPASYPGVVAVGSFGPGLAVSSFSAEGPEVRLLAPGERIASAFPGGLARAGSGTSQSAAFAAGAAALLWSHDPSMPSARVVQALYGGADDRRLDVNASAGRLLR